MPEFQERNFCDGLEMKLTSPLDGIQQAGAPEIAAKSVTPFFLAVIAYKRLDTNLYFITNNFDAEIKPQVKVNHDVNSLAFTPCATYD